MGRVCGGWAGGGAPALLGLLLAVSCWPARWVPNCAEVLVGCGSLEEPRADSRGLFPLQKPQAQEEETQERQGGAAQGQEEVKKKVPPTQQD